MDTLEPVHVSRLKLMALSPAHYLAAAQRETSAKEKGSALHSIVLGGKRCLAYPGKVRRGAEFEAFVAENPDALILTQADHARACGMAEAVMRNRDAMALLKGQYELEVNWTFLGRACQSHIDVLGPGGRYVTELKSAASSQPERFMWQAMRIGYLAQLAFYKYAVEAAGLGEPQDLYVVAVESAPPYVVSLFRLSPEALEHGRKQVRKWFERLLSCEAANEWPGYVGAIVPLDVPEEENFDLNNLTYATDEEAA